MIRALVADRGRDIAPPILARRFHNTIVNLIVEMCTRLGEQAQVFTVVLTGGVFMNAIVAAEVESKLNSAGFCALRHRVVPTNDGGISLGQLAIAAYRLGATKP
jgi:hydrogenase maturation protein HypF